MNRNDLFVEILKDQVKPALGCTEPAAVALAVARAKELLDDTIDYLEITVNNNILKNGMSVGIPGTQERGLPFAAALSLQIGKSNYGLQVFKDVDRDSIEKALEMVSNEMININLDKSKTSLYIEVIAKTDSDMATVRIEDAHTNIVYEVVGNKVILNKVQEESTSDQKDDQEKDLKFGIMDYKVKDLIQFVKEVPAKDLEFIQTGVDMNLKLAQVALLEDIGPGIGKHYIAQANDIQSKAKAFTVAASEARMTGYPLPVMSSAGSGNHGLVAIVPLSIIGPELNYKNHKVLRSIALSHLVTIYVKVQLGALSPVCGCAVAAGLGCSAGLTYLLNGTDRQIQDSIINMIAGVSGMFCDGAKIGCAYKLGISVDAAFDASSMARKGIVFPSDNGILGETAEESIANLAKVSTDGMSNTDPVILDIMMNKC